MRKIGYMVRKALEYRMKPGNDDKFTDIWYKNLITNSITELEKIYHLNGGLTPGLTERFRRHELEHPHRKHGVHQYSLMDFGLTEADIDAHTESYRKFIADRYDSHKTEKI